MACTAAAVPIVVSQNTSVHTFTQRDKTAVKSSSDNRNASNTYKKNSIYFFFKDIIRRQVTQGTPKGTKGGHKLKMKKKGRYKHSLRKEMSTSHKINSNSYTKKFRGSYIKIK